MTVTQEDYAAAAIEWMNLKGFNVSHHMMHGLARYVETGGHTGDFLSAVLRGDLHRATKYADERNYPQLHVWSHFIQFFVPSAAYDSYNAVDQWEGLSSDGMRTMIGHIERSSNHTKLSRK